MKLIISLALSLLVVTTAFAQKEKVTVETQFPAGPLSADKLPLPPYPKLAKDAGYGGAISVDVTLDEKGNVATAENASGPYPVCQSVTEAKVVELRNAALAAAKKAHFQLTEVQPGSSPRGRIIYNFDSGKGADSTSGIAGLRMDRMTKLGTSDSDTGARVVGPDEVVVTKKAGGPPKTVSGGVLNGKALALPAPKYPAAARAVHAGGPVSVQVLIFEDGTVYSAAAVSGHPLLRAVSEIAACRSSFSPTLLEGNPVKVSGVITYNYVP